ncbi:hypothetical protein [Galbitalea soli]|uniref:Protein tyrosine phosphatase n=1 Tax=Galbitalea soli TaxID=1268042 RepID=A0A7C9TQ64_9MICO|nr:hypothetical protein [Galbitalea soli]NEM90063.1 hypothetical protein [Galbitalea soli]NYJ30770.1 hypothetical protein [Galbitalea soli]
MTGKIAVAAFAIVAAATGGTVAAYAGVLPAPLQQVAHSAIGAPSVGTSDETPQPGDTSSPEPSDTPDPTDTPEPTDTATPEPTDTAVPTPSPTTDAKGPDATGPAAFGLCTAYTHGGLHHPSTAHAALALASGGETGIDAYCALVLGTVPTSTPTAVPTDTPTSTATVTAPRTHHVHPAHPSHHGKGGHKH